MSKLPSTFTPLGQLPGPCGPTPLQLSACGPFTFHPQGHPSLTVQGAGEEIEFLLQDLQHSLGVKARTGPLAPACLLSSAPCSFSKRHVI